MFRVGAWNYERFDCCSKACFNRGDSAGSIAEIPRTRGKAHQGYSFNDQFDVCMVAGVGLHLPYHARFRRARTPEQFERLIGH
jgi:hypothetical protein